MDSVIQTNIDELLSEFKEIGASLSDPVSKLMVTTLIHQAQKIKDEINSLPTKVMDRLCSTFIPKNKIEASPALCLVRPDIKFKKDVQPHTMVDGTFFSFKIDNKVSLNYYPLFKNQFLPISASHFLSNRYLRSKDSVTPLDLSIRGKVWLGLELPVEIESLQNVSFLIRGQNIVMPKRIFLGNDMIELSFVPASQLTDVPIMEPFDSQQVNSSLIATFSQWQRMLEESENGRLIYITDALTDRDAFKYRAYPKLFQQYLESSDLDRFDNNTLWILFDFGDEYVIPETLHIIPNVVPVVNVSVNSTVLTQTAPIAKLTKDDGSYFFSIVETSLPAQKQGFNTLCEDVVVRNFDVNCYDKNVLYRDVRNLYNRFVDDYHAFIDYHGLKDGELIRALREIVNKIGKNVISEQGIKNRFDEGTYVMRKVGLIGKTATIKVSYLTTNGKLGNLPKDGMFMENKKDPAFEKDVKVVSFALGGEDKADADQRYEMFRYYTLTRDRLYTKMDIDAFLRLQLLKEFGKEEVKRISHEITIQGAPGTAKLCRGLYIDIAFKDKKNFLKAVELALDRKIQRMIEDKSCIAMPIIVNLVNIESIS